MKSTTFKTRQDMLDYFKIEKDPDEVDVITDHLPEPKCGMDELVEKLADEEAAYWEAKAEIYYDI